MTEPVKAGELIPTPRVDAFYEALYPHSTLRREFQGGEGGEAWDFARTLERELAEAHRELAEIWRAWKNTDSALSEQRARVKAECMLVCKSVAESKARARDMNVGRVADTFNGAMAGASDCAAAISALPDSASDTLGKPLGKPCKIKKD